jgi:tetratricopeptide (TPR) repeat protein
MCLGGLQERADASSRLLYARTLLRLGRPGDAVEVLQATPVDGHRLLAERFALLAASLTRLGRFDDAADALTNARAYAYGSCSVALEAEVEYFGGLAAYAQGDLAGLETASHRILGLVEPRDLSGEGAEYVVPLAHTRARAFEALGAVALSRGLYHDQAAYTRKALRELDGARVTDVWIAAVNVTNLAVLAGNYDLFEHVEYLRDRLTSTPWTDELASRRFTALDAFGWHLALRGDNIGAFRQFRIAADVASTLPDRVLASVSRAHLAHELGHEPVAIEELEHALALSKSFEWDEANEQRVVLLHLAEAAAPLAPDEARVALERYRQIRTKLATLSLTHVEPWIAAAEDFTEGLLARAEGNRLKAIDSLLRAHERWSDVLIDWRAAGAAIELAELGAGERFVREARREAVRRPASWLARRAAALAEQPEPAS